VNIYKWFTLKPNLKKKIRYRLTFSPGTSVRAFWRFQQFLLYFTRIHYCVTGSDDLKSLFRGEMNVRNLKIAGRLLYENNFTQLDNKNVKINV